MIPARSVLHTMIKHPEPAMVAATPQGQLNVVVTQNVEMVTGAMDFHSKADLELIHK